jgi:aspartyl-tRNA(Asn)/glutamyl-tRNA(Gln) amidotransferase subunit C
VTAETVDAVARLARLSLGPGERETFARQLDQILTYAESLQGLPTDGVEPMSHAAARPAFRDDTPCAGLSREAALAGAPDAADGLYRAPRILAG